MASPAERHQVAIGIVGFVFVSMMNLQPVFLGGAFPAMAAFMRISFAYFFASPFSEFKWVWTDATAPFEMVFFLSELRGRCTFATAKDLSKDCRGGSDARLGASGARYRLLKFWADSSRHWISMLEVSLTLAAAKRFWVLGYLGSLAAEFNFAFETCCLHWNHFIMQYFQDQERLLLC